MDTHLDAGSQGWNNALWQELPSHSLTLHDQVTQCIQTKLLRAGQQKRCFGPGWGRRSTPVLEGLGTGECEMRGVCKSVGIRGKRFSSFPPACRLQLGPKAQVLNLNQERGRKGQGLL